MSLPSATNPRPFRLHSRNYRLWFDDAGALAHIDGQRHKRSGRTAWVWIWPLRGRHHDTPTSRAVRAALAAEALAALEAPGEQMAKPFMGVIKEWGILPRGRDKVVVGTLISREEGVADTDLITSPVVLLGMTAPDEGVLETQHSRYRLLGRGKKLNEVRAEELT